MLRVIYQLQERSAGFIVLTAAKRILRYLTDLALKYDKSKEGSLIGYADADWGGDPDNRHSTGGAISWSSKKASSCSTVNFRSGIHYTKPCHPGSRLDYDRDQSSNQTRVLIEDNQGAIAIARNPIAHGRTKHIDIRFYYVREAVQDGVIDFALLPNKCSGC